MENDILFVLYFPPDLTSKICSSFMRNEHGELSIVLGRSITVIHGQAEFQPNVQGDVLVSGTIRLGDMSAKVWTTGGTKILKKILTKKICAYLEGHRGKDGKILVRLSLCRTRDDSVLWDRSVSVSPFEHGYRRE